MEKPAETEPTKMSEILAYVKDFFKDRVEDAEFKIGLMDKHRTESKTFVDWAQYNLTDYIETDILKSEWTDYSRSFDRFLADKEQSDSEIIERVDFMKEHIIRDILKENPSQKTITAMIDNCRINILRKMVGDSSAGLDALLKHIRALSLRNDIKKVSDSLDSLNRFEYFDTQLKGEQLQ